VEDRALQSYRHVLDWHYSSSGSISLRKGEGHHIRDLYQVGQKNHCSIDIRYDTIWNDLLVFCPVLSIPRSCVNINPAGEKTATYFLAQFSSSRRCLCNKRMAK
jgi:hypothetical protein